MKALLIAEKPSLMRAIMAAYIKHQDEIGIEIKALAQAGHLLGLKSPDEINPVYKKWELDNLPLNLNFKYKVLKGKNGLVKNIKDEIKSGKYDFIIHAGDPDQEGEILIRETLKHVGNNLPVKRFWSNDITEVAVIAALKNLKDDKEYDNLSDAGFTRQHVDYLYGMNLTEAATLKSKTLLRVGRVKAAILRMVYDREKEIENFVPGSTYERAFIYNQNGKDYQFVDESEAFDTEKALYDTVKGIPTEALVTDSKIASKLVKAPKLYKLSTLQTDAYSKLHFPASMTLDVLQKLYDAGYVSYPRSACEYISSNVDVLGIYSRIKGEIPEIDKYHMSPRLAEDIKSDKMYCNDKAIATEGHTGIIPTGKVPRNLSDAESKLYNLIVRRFAAICVEMGETKKTTVTAKDKNGFSYTCKGDTDVKVTSAYILNPGYKPKVFNLTAAKNDVLTPVTFNPKEIEKQCPARYNEGSLIKAMAGDKEYKEGDTKVKYHIGQESTRANIIAECIKNNYLKVIGGVFSLTDVGKQVVEDYGDLPVFNTELSAKWECAFEDIRDGKSKASDVEDSLRASLNEMIADIKLRDVTKIINEKDSYKSPKKGTGNIPIGNCPCCKIGKVLENSKAFGCSNWNADPKCNLTIWKSAFGTNFTKTDVKKLIEGKTVHKTLKSKEGKPYEKDLMLDVSSGKIVFAEEKANELTR